MSTLITSAILNKESLMLQENELAVLKAVDWQYNGKFEQSDNPIGNTYTLPKPVGVVGTRNNMAWNGANSVLVRNKVTLVIDRSYTVPVSFTDGDMTLKISNFSQNFLKPAIANIASTADFDLVDSIVNSTPGSLSATSGLQTSGLGITTAGVANSAGYAIGAYGTAITPTLVAQANQILIDQSCPQDGEVWGFLSSTAQQQLTIANTTIFHPLTEINGEFRKGLIGTFAGVTFSVTQSMANHVNGAQPTLVVSAGTLTTGWAETATLTVTALAGAINAGDVFQSTTRFIVNYQTHAVTATPFQVQVIAAQGIGDTSVTVTPAPISGGAYQNISGTLNGATLQLTGYNLPGVTPVGSSAVNLSGVESLIFHKSAIVAAAPKLYVPSKGMDMAMSIEHPDAPKFRMRFLRSYDMWGVSAVAGAGGVGSSGPATTGRFDSFYGFKVTQPAWIIRMRN
jgi:hypothetical protein